MINSSDLKEAVWITSLLNYVNKNNYDENLHNTVLEIRKEINNISYGNFIWYQHYNKSIFFIKEKFSNPYDINHTILNIVKQYFEERNINKKIKNIEIITIQDKFYTKNKLIEHYLLHLTNDEDLHGIIIKHNQNKISKSITL